MRNDKGVELYIVNKRAYPFTATLSLKTNNYKRADKSGKDLSETHVLQGFERKLFIALEKLTTSRTA